MRRLEDERLQSEQLMRRRERVRVGPVRAGVGCDVSGSSKLCKTSMSAAEPEPSVSLGIASATVGVVGEYPDGTPADSWRSGTENVPKRPKTPHRRSKIPAIAAALRPRAARKVMTNSVGNPGPGSPVHSFRRRGCRHMFCTECEFETCDFRCCAEYSGETMS